MNAIAEGGNKTSSISLKRHVAFCEAVFDLGKVFEGNAVGFKLLRVRNQTQTRWPGGMFNGFLISMMV